MESGTRASNKSDKHDNDTQAVLTRKEPQEPITRSSSTHKSAADTCFNGLLLQPQSRLITQAQFASEVKSIYSGLKMAEKKRVSSYGAGPAQQARIESKKDESSALHQKLLREHGNSFLFSRHAYIFFVLQRVARHYPLPSHMSTLSEEAVMRAFLGQTSTSRFFGFIYLAIQMLVKPSVVLPTLESDRIQLLGYLSQFCMVANDEYMRNTGRPLHLNGIRHIGNLYRHLTILSRPSAIRELGYDEIALPLCQPFHSSRESISAFLHSIKSRTTATVPLCPPIDSIKDKTYDIVSLELSSHVEFSLFDNAPGDEAAETTTPIYPSDNDLKWNPVFCHELQTFPSYYDSWDSSNTDIKPVFSSYYDLTGSKQRDIQPTLYPSYNSTNTPYQDDQKWAPLDYYSINSLCFLIESVSPAAHPLEGGLQPMFNPCYDLINLSHGESWRNISLMWPSPSWLDLGQTLPLDLDLSTTSSESDFISTLQSHTPVSRPVMSSRRSMKSRPTRRPTAPKYSTPQSTPSSYRNGEHSIQVFEIPSFIEAGGQRKSGNALADYCAKSNFINEKYAKQEGFLIDASAASTVAIGSGKKANTAGIVKTNFRFKDEAETSYSMTFHVLPDCIHNLILGKPFLKATRTLSSVTNFARRVTSRLANVAKRHLLYLGATAPKFSGLVNGKASDALADSGSNILIVDEDYAKDLGLPVSKGRTRVLFADGSTAYTSGITRGVKWQFGQGDTEEHYLDFHVLKDAPAPVILSDSFLFETQAYSKYECYLIDEDEDETLEEDEFLFTISYDPTYQSHTAIKSTIKNRTHIETCRRNQEEDRIASLPPQKRGAAWIEENERRAKWDRDMELLRRNQNGHTSSTSSNNSPPTVPAAVNGNSSPPPSNSTATGGFSDPSITNQSASQSIAKKFLRFKLRRKKDP